MPAAMPCKIPTKSSGKTHLNNGKRKTKYACDVDADESTRPRFEGAGHKPHQDHITEKGTNSFTHYSLVHEFIPMLQALKIPDAKAAVEKELEKLEKRLAWQLTKVRNKNEVIKEASCVQVAICSDESVFFFCDKFFRRIESDCIWKSGDADRFGENRKQDEKKIQNSTQRRVLTRLKDGYLGRLTTATGKLVATKEESGDVDFSESETGAKKMWQGNRLHFFSCAKTVCIQ